MVWYCMLCCGLVMQIAVASYGVALYVLLWCNRYGVVCYGKVRCRLQNESFLLFLSSSKVCNRSSRGMSVCPGGMLGSGVFFTRSSSSYFHSS